MNINRNNTNRFVPPVVGSPVPPSNFPNQRQSIPPVGKQDVTFPKNIPVVYVIPVVVLLAIMMILIITQMIRLQLLVNDIQNNHILNNEGSTLKMLAKNATKSVVAIKAIFDEDKISSGTGVVIARDEKSVLILTNRHVVVEEETSSIPLKILIVINNGEDVKEGFIVATPSIPLVDLALIFMGDTRGLLIPQWKIASLESMEQGDSVYAIGHPLDFPFTITEGICSAQRNFGTHWAIQHTAAINPGNSGGPLFNSSGNIVGINTFGINNTQGMFFALSADFVREQSQWTFYEKEEQTKLLLEKVRYVGN